MPSPGSLALQRGHAALRQVHPQTWMFGTRTFTTPQAELLKSDDRRLMDEPVARLALRVLTAELPVPVPKRGDFLQKVDQRGVPISAHRILAIDPVDDTFTEVLLAGTGTAGD